MKTDDESLDGYCGADPNAARKVLEAKGSADAVPPLGEGGLYGTFARYAQRFGGQARTVEVTLTPSEICQIRDALSLPAAYAHPQPQQAETCQVIQGYPLCRDSCAKVGKCLHAPKPQQADGRGAVIEECAKLVENRLGIAEKMSASEVRYRDVRLAQAIRALSQALATEGAAVTRPERQAPASGGTSE